MVNLFIAVILDVFEDNKQDMEQDEQLASVYKWRDEWMMYDTRARGRIRAKAFLQTLIYAPEPAGFNGKEPSEEDMTRKLLRLHLITSKNAEDDDVYCDCDFVPEGIRKKVNQCVTAIMRLNDKSADDEEDSNSSFNELKEENVMGSAAKTGDVEMAKMGDDNSDFDLSEHSDQTPWCIEYQAAVTAMCVYVLDEKGDLELPIFVEKIGNEKKIAEWYTEDHINRPGLLKQLIHERDREETGQMLERFARIPTASSIVPSQLEQEMLKEQENLEDPIQAVSPQVSRLPQTVSCNDTVVGTVTP